MKVVGWNMDMSGVVGWSKNRSKGWGDGARTGVGGW